MRIKNILLNVLLLIFLFVLIYLYIYINYNIYEKFTSLTRQTFDSNKSDTDPIYEEGYEPVNETYIGIDSKNAFKSVVDIMCQNRVVALRGSSAGTSFGNGYYWINIPSIENVIFASPSKSKIRNLQSIGRGLRLKEGKTHCNLYDISDDLHWKSWKNHTLGHFAERLKTYSEEKFNYKIIEVDLE